MPRGAQNPKHPGFVGRADYYDCAACIGWHAKEYHFPVLADEHVEAWNLYLMLADQQRIGMDVIGLDYNVLPGVFAMEGVPRWRWRTLFAELVTINHAHLAQRAHERERAAQDARNHAHA